MSERPKPKRGRAIVIKKSRDSDYEADEKGYYHKKVSKENKKVVKMNERRYFIVRTHNIHWTFQNSFLISAKNTHEAMEILNKRVKYLIDIAGFYDKQELTKHFEEAKWEVVILPIDPPAKIWSESYNRKEEG